MILAIETATEICSVALVHNGAVISSRSVNEKNIHSERLMLLIDDVITETKRTKHDIDAVAVSVGPGSFTGLRIGLSAAKGLALALKKPIIAVPTLDGIAESFRISLSKEGTVAFCALIDAKRNEAFYAAFTVSPGEIERITDYHIKDKEEIVTESRIRQWETKQPAITAISIGLFGERRRKEFEVSDFSRLEPLYLREFVATLPKK